MGRRGRTSVLAAARRLTRLARVPGVPGRYAAPFWVVSGVHLAAQLGRALDLPGSDVVAPVSKALLLPALAVVLAKGLDAARERRPATAGAGEAAGRGPLPSWWTLAAVALTFSWFGDLALISPDLFLAGVGCFGIAQVQYAVVFSRIGDPARTANRPGLLAPYVVWWLGLAGFFLATGGVTPFLLAVGTYGVALGSMAFLAHRISPATAAGAALFVLSDSLIGLGGAGLELPAHGFWVMATYLAAQWLIVRGLVARGVALRDQAGPADLPTPVEAPVRSRP